MEDMEMRIKSAVVILLIGFLIVSGTAQAADRDYNFPGFKLYGWDINLMGLSVHNGTLHNISGINEDLGSREIVVNTTRNSVHTNEIIRYYNATQNISIDNTNVDFLIENEDLAQNLIVYSNIRDNGWNFFYAQRARGTNHGNGTVYITPLLSGDSILGINVRGYAGGTGWSGSTGSITYSTSGNWNTTYNPTKLNIAWLKGNPSDAAKQVMFENDSFMPKNTSNGDSFVDLGSTSFPWNHTYTKNTTVTLLAGAGNALAQVDSTGKLDKGNTLSGSGNVYLCWNFTSNTSYAGNPTC